MKFIHEIDKLSTGKLVDRGYWEIVNDPPYKSGCCIKVENSYGGWHYRTITENDEIIESDWTTINYNYYLNKTDSPYGWIDKEGKFYGCDYFEHNDCAITCFGLYEGSAERAGYVKVYKENNEVTYY